MIITSRVVNNTEVAQELEITEQQIDHDRHKDLALDGVSRTTDEGLDPQVLFDKLFHRTIVSKWKLTKVSFNNPMGPKVEYYHLPA